MGRGSSHGRVVSAGMDSKLCVWNAAGAPRCAELLGHTGSVSAVRVSADGALAVSASYDKSLRVWPLGGGGGGGGTPLRAHRAPVLQLVFEGDVLASADRDGAVVAWDLGRGAATTALGRHGGHATALATDGGEALVSGGQDGVVRLWDLRSLQVKSKIVGHSDFVRALASAGERLITAADDKTIRIWDLEFHDCAKVLKGHTSYINALLCARARLFSASMDKTIKIWE